jgi:protein TonB
MKARALVIGALLGGCTSGSPPPAEPEPTVAPSAEISPPSPPPASAPPAGSSAPPVAERPVPPLSTPNPRPSSSAADAGAPPSDVNVRHVDPQQLALRRAGEAAQACYERSKLPRGTAGKLLLRVVLGPDGSVERVEIERSQSTAKLLGGPFETCVLEIFRKQSFPAPRAGAEVVLEVPLEFRPIQ